MFRLVLFFILIFSSVRLFSQEFVVSGYIFDFESGEPLIGANVYEAKLKVGTTTNQSGFFSLPVKNGYRVITFVHDGFISQSDSIYLGKDEEVFVNLISYEDWEEFLMDEKREGNGQLPLMNPVSMPINQLRYMPPVFGEVDLLKSLQFMPGIQSGIEGSNGMYVRGGSPDQNLVMLDGVPVYNVNHIFGFFSAFNTEAISSFQLYKGGFPARFGSRLSSVLDISLKDGNTQNFTGSAGISIVSLYGFLEGPIISDKTTLALSFRRSWPGIVNALNPFVTPQESQTSGSYFYDINAKISHRISNKDKIHLYFYNGRDKFYATERTEYKNNNSNVVETHDDELYWGNTTASLRWVHQASSRRFASYAASFTRYQLNVSNEFLRVTQTGADKEEFSIFQRYFSGIQDYSLKADYENKISYKHQLRYGAIYTLHAFAPGNIEAKLRTPGLNLDTMQGNNRRILGHEAAVYFEDDIHWSKRFRTNVGVRFSLYHSEGTTYMMPEPRFSSRYLLNAHWSLKASYSLMNQYIHLLSNSGFGLPSDLWVPSTARVKPERAQQFAVGLNKIINSTWELSMEGFYKLMDNVIDYSEGLSFINAQNDWENRVQMGKGKVYGAEFLIQKKYGEVLGSLAYTLSWNKRQFEEINGGREYYFRYDRRHYVTFTSTINANDYNIFSLNMVYGTGSPVTFPFGRYLDADGNEVYDYVEKNSYRLRSYFRVDFSYVNVRDRWDVDMKQEFVLSVFNVFNRFNPYYMYLSKDSVGRPVAKEISLLPFFPSFAYNIRF